MSSIQLCSSTCINSILGNTHRLPYQDAKMASLPIFSTPCGCLFIQLNFPNWLTHGLSWIDQCSTIVCCVNYTKFKLKRIFKKDKTGQILSARCENVRSLQPEVQTLLSGYFLTFTNIFWHLPMVMLWREFHKLTNYLKILGSEKYLPWQIKKSEQFILMIVCPCWAIFFVSNIPNMEI